MYILSLILILLGFALIILMLDYKTNVKTITQDDCGDLEYTQTIAYNDFLKPKLEQEGLLACYCIQEFRTQLYGVASITFPNEETLCASWLEEFSLALTVIYGLALSITILNAILRVFLRGLSVFEGKHTTTERLAAATRKMWLV